MRDHLNEVAPRRMAVLDPLKLVIDNFDPEKTEQLELPNPPQKPEMGKRQVPFSRELWIEREDYQETPQKGFFRLFPGNSVRLRFAYVIKVVGMKDGAIHCTYHEDSRSGTPGSDNYKVKGNIHWVSAKHAHPAEVRLYERLFKAEHPKGMEDLNPESLRTITSQLETSLATAQQGDSFQFERHGYFIADRGGFNRTVTLRQAAF
jgi:glutaminyl-tRNA synthetase